MAKFNNGYENIKVTLIQSPGNDFAKSVYEFGRLSHDYYIPLQETYDENSDDCKNLSKRLSTVKHCLNLHCKALDFNSV